jgi:hypothetical protein
MFPDWKIEALCAVAGTGPDSWYLLASRGWCDLLGVDCWNLAAGIRREINAR